MRGTPSCEFTVTRFGAWRAAVAVLAAGSCMSLLAWAVTAPQAASGGARVAVGGALAIVFVLAAGLWRQPARVLRWNGSTWTVADAGAAGIERAGRIEPMIDLGSFLLLRFRPADRRATPLSATWIPLGRGGLEPEWHAIRCAVHGTGSAGAAARATFR